MGKIYGELMLGFIIICIITYICLWRVHLKVGKRLSKVADNVRKEVEKADKYEEEQK